MRVILICLVALIAFPVSAQKVFLTAKDESTGKWGFADVNGNVVIPVQFDKLGDLWFNNYRTDLKYAPVQYKGKWGCIDEEGEFIVKPIFHRQQDAVSAGNEWRNNNPLGYNLYSMQDTRTLKWGFVNYLGNWVIRPQFEKLGDLCFYRDKDIPVQYAAVRVKGKWGCIDKKGDFIVKPIFERQQDASGAAHRLAKSYEIESVPLDQIPNYADLPTNGYVLKNKKDLVQQQTPSSAPRQTGTTSGPQQTASNTPQKENQKVTENTTAATNVKSSSDVATPTLAILSPANGDGYNQSDVSIRYSAKTFDGKDPELLISINGEPYDMKTKGVKRSYQEIILQLPAKEGKCNITLIAKDSQGKSSDPVYLSLLYTGEKQKPALHVLAVGIGQYIDAAVPNLDHAAKDAKDFASLIADINSGHYRKIESPILLTDENATSVNIKTSIMELARNVSQEDVVFLFFSGHGDEENQENYFLSSDAKADNLFSTAVNFNDIRTAMRILTGKQCRVITFMDACYAGALYNTKSISQSLQFAAPGVISYYSSTESQKSNEADKWQNGIFTKALIDGIKGKAKDKNGNITTLELERYIKETVTEETAGKQTPIIENKLGEFVLF